MSAWRSVARMAWRQLWRDLASGDARVLLASLVLSVAAVTAVSFITDRADRALSLEGNRLLGGDAVLRADTSLPEAPRELADALGLQRTESWSFPSMVRASEGLKLAEIRALGAGFPLRGAFRLQGIDGAESVIDSNWEHRSSSCAPWCCRSQTPRSTISTSRRVSSSRWMTSLRRD